MKKVYVNPEVTEIRLTALEAINAGNGNVEDLKPEETLEHGRG